MSPCCADGIAGKIPKLLSAMWCALLNHDGLRMEGIMRRSADKTLVIACIRSWTFGYDARGVWPRESVRHSSYFDCYCQWCFVGWSARTLSVSPLLNHIDRLRGMLQNATTSAHRSRRCRRAWFKACTPCPCQSSRSCAQTRKCWHMPLVVPWTPTSSACHTGFARAIWSSCSSVTSNPSC